jgi:hypothetical protein
MICLFLISIGDCVGANLAIKADTAKETAKEKEGSRCKCAAFCLDAYPQTSVNGEKPRGKYDFFAV